MLAGYSGPLVALVVAVVLFGGVVKGLVGFGYAIASTAVLATVLGPTTAVVAMILPTMVANLALFGELDVAGVRKCVRRFWPYVGAAMAGTTAGMLALADVPRSALALMLGAFTLGYVLVRQRSLRLPGESVIARHCFTDGFGAKVGLGLLSGAIFGAGNVAVQVVAYLENLSLDRSTFASVLAMILVGISAVRVGIAWWLGLYGSGRVFVLSMLAVPPGFVGVALGRRLRLRAPDRLLDAGVLILLAAIGLRLLVGGAVGL